MKVNREIVRMQLVRWCEAPAPGKAYFRPLVCRGNIEDVDIFVVHSHPVTPIPPPLDCPSIEAAKARELHAEFSQKFPVADFVNRLMDYSTFLEMHHDVRRALGKDLVTLPQQRMNAFVSANPHPEKGVAEVFLNAYPAKDAAALKKEDRKTVERGYDLFFEMLQLFRPSWVILLGKPAFDAGADYLNRRFGIPEFRKKWTEIDPKEPRLVALATVRLAGSKCKIVGSRHFDKRPVSGVADSEYTDERFQRFCQSAWATLSS